MDVHYNPEYPQEALLEPQAPLKTYYFMIAGALISFLGFIRCFPFLQKKKTIETEDYKKEDNELAVDEPQRKFARDRQMEFWKQKF